MGRFSRACAALLGAMVCGVLPASAQPRERGYVAISGGGQTAGDGFSDRFTYTFHAEQAMTQARYPSKPGVLFDGGGGLRVWRALGAGVHVTHASVTGGVRTESQIPHPFFDNRHRHVSGDGGDVSRTETAAHVQVYFRRDAGRWRLQLGAGPSHFSVQQDIVTGIAIDEQYPYDTATFRDASTRRARESAVGFNVSADVARMFTSRFGAGVLVRFARGAVDLNVGDPHRVSLDTGGVQAAAGVRMAF